MLAWLQTNNQCSDFLSKYVFQIHDLFYSSIEKENEKKQQVTKYLHSGGSVVKSDYMCLKNHGHKYWSQYKKIISYIIHVSMYPY